MDQTNIANLPTSAFSGGLTETGALIGTPLYMAPELYAGKPADERSDQFAFCASLYEGLYRQLPFGERSLAAHMDAVAAGRVVAPPEHSPVPPSLWKLVARGLDADPLARHPGMGSLLDALEREAAQPVGELARGSGAWRALAIAGGVGLLVAGWVGVEMGWFAGKGADAQAQLGGGELAVGDPAGVDARAIDASATNTGEPAQAQPELVEIEPEPEQPEPEQSEPEPEQPERASETGSSEASVALEAAPAVEPGPELNGWCHLHEDHLTLIKRTDSRRAQIEERGKCYRCRVERRRSRWRSFSPRDCAGYSLCGPVAAEECK